MTKTELMETYTAEQLAEMVVNLQNGKENKVFKVQANKNYQKELDEFLKESSIHNSIDKICKDILEQKNNAMAMEFTRIICDLLKKYGVYVHCTEIKFGEKITKNSIEEKYGIAFDSLDFSQHDKEFMDKIKKLEDELKKCNREHERTLWEFCDSIKKEDYDSKVNFLQSEVEKYHKAFEDAKKERDCQTCEYQKKIEELENHHKFSMMQIDDVLVEFLGVTHEIMDSPTEFEKILQETIENSKTVSEYKNKIEKLKKELQHAQNTITEINGILNEIFGVTYDIVNPNEFEKILKQTPENHNTIADYLCDEPISVANTLISLKRSYELTDEEKQQSGLSKGYYHIFDVPKLRQIAEHLMVYCDYNGDMG